jgi:hypothetical protein
MMPVRGECTWNIVDRTGYAEGGYSWFVFDVNGDCIEHGVAPDANDARQRIAIAVVKLVLNVE